MTDTNKPVSAGYAGRDQTLQVNKERTSEIIGKALDDMIRSNSAEKIPLSDLPRVKQAAQEYLKECSDRAMMPTVRGMAARLGLSRNSVYDYQRNHPDSEFAKFLDDFSDMCGEIMMAAAMDKSIDVVSAIFVCKSRHGYREVNSIELVNNSPLGSVASAEEIAARYNYLLTEEDD